MPQTLKKQALTLTIANGFTRGLGFLFRLMTARLMGAEAIGVMELSASAAMLALTPATAGLPTAMSRVTARPNANQSAVLRAGLSLNRRIALVMMPLLFLLAPGMAWLLSDFRTLPFIDCPAHHTAGDQHVEVCTAHAHVRSGFRCCPKLAGVLFERACLFHLLVRRFEQLLQGKQLLFYLVICCAHNQLKSGIQIVRFQLQGFVEIFRALFSGRCPSRKLQIIAGRFG